MDALPYQELSCKACYYSTSQLLDFLNHVRKVHYERHASKTDMSHKTTKQLASETNSTSVEHVTTSDTGKVVATESFITCTENALSHSANDSGSHTIGTKDLKASHSNVDQVVVKSETIDCEAFGAVHESFDSDGQIENFAQSLNESSSIKKETVYSQRCDEIPTKHRSSTSSKSDIQTPFRGKKINNIADTLKVSYAPDTKPVIDAETGNVVGEDPISFQVKFSASKEVQNTNTFVPSHGFCMASDRESNPACFLQRRNSVPVSMHHDADKNHSTSSCAGNIFQPFPNVMDKQGFPNYLSRYDSNNANIHPHQLSFHTSEGSFSQGASLFDSTGGFLPGFHALMCAGFVTMPRTQVLQSIKCDEKKWQYIQQTLHNAFRKFPYLTAPEVQVLANLTELTCQQVKTLFAVARLQHGISWDQEEIQNARNYLRIPGNRFCGEG